MATQMVSTEVTFFTEGVPFLHHKEVAIALISRDLSSPIFRSGGAQSHPSLTPISMPLNDDMTGVIEE